MKTMNWKTKLWTLGLLILTLGCASLPQRSAASTAGYYRLWQGFQKTGVSNDGLLEALPSFMKETVELYGNASALNQYFVLMPPKAKPASIPEELALVALTSETDYRAIRATPEGTRYSDRHWDLFEKATSKSSKRVVDFEREKPTALEAELGHSMLSPSLDWSEGASYAFIGTRKPGFTQAQFLARLKAHVELATSRMRPRGLRGYLVIATPEYEIAYLNWTSAEDHDRAFATDDGKAVFGDGAEFMDTLMYQEATELPAGAKVENGKFYKVLR
jgi:hypothetical protein